MGELELNYSADAVRVIFNDAFSYHLKFLWGHRIPTMKEHGDHAGNLPTGNNVTSHKEACLTADVCSLQTYTA